MLLKLRSCALAVGPVTQRRLRTRGACVYSIYYWTHVRQRHIHREYTGSLDDVFFPLIFDSVENLYFAVDSDEISFCSIMQDWQVDEGLSSAASSARHASASNRCGSARS